MNVALLHYVMYTLTTDISAHVTSFLPMPPAKRWALKCDQFAHGTCIYRSD